MLSASGLGSTVSAAAGRRFCLTFSLNKNNPATLELNHKDTEQ